MSDKPRYRGEFTGDVLNLHAVREAVADAQRAGKVSRAGGGERRSHPRVSVHHGRAVSVTRKPRYRGWFDEHGQLRTAGPGTVSGPGRLSPTENEVLRELGNQERGGGVQITYYPTRTSNPADPRTAAAGYDPVTRTLRVEWGDGGRPYNYFQVEPEIWQRFKRSASPGRFIDRILNDYPYGPA